ncbi:Ubiquinone biosynthesis O-methyltransferase [compost metagenome]
MFFVYKIGISRMKFLSGFMGDAIRRLCVAAPGKDRLLAVVADESPSEFVFNAPASADPEQWEKSQEYELSFWKEQWPYRHLSVAELQQARHKDAMWFLGKMGFLKGGSDYRYEGFDGTVLEVGCGPIGFFEMVGDVSVTAQDSLMRLYAENLPFSMIGKRGSVTYIKEDLADVGELFDFVVCSNVLDHTADWIQFLMFCSKRVKKDGELLLVTDSRGIPAIGHTQIFSHSQLVRVLELLGAKEFRVDAVEREDGVHCDYRHYLRAVF